MQMDTSARPRSAAQQLDRARDLLERLELDGLLLTGQDNVAWITDGIEDAVIRGTDPGLVWALVTRDRALLVTQTIEAPRVEQEEQAAAAGFELATFPWWEDGWGRIAAEVVPPERLGNDGAGPGRGVAAELSALKVDLTDVEQERLRRLGADAAEAVEGAMRAARAGQSERELAAELVARLELRAIFPSVLLVGSGERRMRFRHPTVSDAPMEGSALAVLVGRRAGLNVALSRSVSFGAPDPQLARRHEHAAEVEACEIAATRPGATWGEALQAGIDAYERLGCPDEWRHHYQGGAVGYGPREFSPGPLAHPNAWSGFPVRAGQAGAWNPTIRGAKSEDTFLVHDDGAEIVTATGDWPQLELHAGEQAIARPALLRVG